MIKLNQKNVYLCLFLLFFGGISLENYPKKKELDPESQEFYKFARYLFTKYERKIFLKLPSPKERQRFIDHFWKIRDPNPFTEENEFKEEMEERFKYVTKYLKEGPIPGWKTDRGRIYILLGKPSDIYEKPPLSGSNRMSHIGIIMWYYAKSRILAYFIDENGYGVYRLNPNLTSLRLLNELENRRYYITNKKNSKFETDLINFDFTYNSLYKELQFIVDLKNINFKSSGKQMIAKFKIELTIYAKKNRYLKHSDVKSIYIDKESLLKKNYKIKFNIPISSVKGKVKIDAILIDLLGNSAGRKFKHFKAK